MIAVASSLPDRVARPSPAVDPRLRARVGALWAAAETSMTETVEVLDAPPAPGDDAGARQRLQRFFAGSTIGAAVARRASTAPLPAPLSLHFAFGGARSFEMDRRRALVRDGATLVLDRGTWAASHVDSHSPVRTLSLYFADRLAREAARCFTEAEERLLDDPERLPGETLRVVEQTYAVPPELDGCVRRLRAGVAAGCREGAWLEERMRLCLDALLRMDAGARLAMARVPARRASTREELYRRLNHARDFMEASLHESLELARLSRVACMAPHHFLRSFRALFGETPFRWLTRRRLERARELLLGTGRPVGEICMSVGFLNYSSFTRSFREEFGLPPTRLRAGTSRTAGAGDDGVDLEDVADAA